MAQSPEEMTATMIRNLEKKTGKTLDAWLKITQTSGIDKHKALTDFLKSEHGVSHGYANLIAHKTLKSDAGSLEGETDLIAAQYAGPKAGLRPIYEGLIAAINKFGKDVEIAPKKAYVSVRRSKQFAIIQPSTKTRVDVGINLKGMEPGERLEASGSFNAMVSHRVRLSEPNDVDVELTAWLKQAYDQA